MKNRVMTVLTALLAAAAVVSGAVIVSAADPVYTDGFEYLSNGDGTCVLSGMGSCTEAVIFIPSESPDGDKVTAIAAEAFAGSAVTAVEIPAGVTSIGDNAFMYCADLSSVTIPEGVAEIGSGAFSYCSSLSEIVLPASLASLFDGAFEGCDVLSSVTFLSAGTVIDPGAVPAGTKIIAPAGSTAEAYAAANGCAFEALPAGCTVATEALRAFPGKMFSLPISLTGNPGMNYLKLRVTYDASVLELTGVTAGDVFPEGLFQPSSETTADPYVLVWGSAENVTADGTLCTLTFTVKADAADADTSVTVAVAECIDETDAEVAVSVACGAITVKSYLPGDVNEDGRVSGVDLTHLLQYLADWPDVVLLPDAADVTADGLIDGRDVTLLLQYLAEWDVVLGVPES